MKKIWYFPLILVALIIGIFLFLSNRSAVSKGYEKDQLTIHTLQIGFSNVHVVQFNGKTLMIDGAEPGREPDIEKALKKIEVDPAGIKYLILTHGHYDHAGTIEYFRQKYGTKIIAGKPEAPMLAGGGKGDGTICPTNLMARMLLKKSAKGSYAPLEADIWVEDPFDLDSLGFPGEIRVVPGHTPGSLVILIESKAFVGDLIRGDPIFKRTPKLHYYMCDLEDNRRDIQQLLENKDIDEWYPGHFGPLAVEAIAKYSNRQF